MDTNNQNEMANEEYFKAVLKLQPDVIASTNKKLSAKARKLALADYEKWVLQCREHTIHACWDLNCPGKLEFVLEYKLAQERGASIVTARCSLCGKEHRLQDYEENLQGMKSRTRTNTCSSKYDIEYKQEEIEDLKKKLEEAKQELKALKSRAKKAQTLTKTLEGF